MSKEDIIEGIRPEGWKNPHIDVVMPSYITYDPQIEALKRTNYERLVARLAYEAGADALIKAGYRQVETVELKVLSPEEIKEFIRIHRDEILSTPDAWEEESMIAQAQIDSIGTVYKIKEA